MSEKVGENVVKDLVLYDHGCGHHERAILNWDEYNKISKAMDCLKDSKDRGVVGNSIIDNAIQMFKGRLGTEIPFSPTVSSVGEYFTVYL